mmetsp:Transcript_8531/g.13154  ORF Transcript_8531/g.13154 Transcript_8531/m.13154 type:complete len:176 (-) Transcript_8531:1274-1801(-)
MKDGDEVQNEEIPHVLVEESIPNKSQPPEVAKAAEPTKERSRDKSKKKSKSPRPTVDTPKPKRRDPSSGKEHKAPEITPAAEIISPLSKAVEDQVMKSDEPLMAKVEAAIAVGRERSSRAAKTSAAEKMSTQNKMSKATQKQYSSFLISSSKNKKEDQEPMVADSENEVKQTTPV